MDRRMNADLCIRHWSTNIKGTVQSINREGYPEKQSPIIQNNDYEVGGGRGCHGCLSLHCEDREGFVHSLL